MNTSFSVAQLEQFRRDARRISRKQNCPLSSALDQIASSKGFANWSLLAKRFNAAERPPLNADVVTAAPFKLVDLRRRQYLHGDRDEDDPEKYYCAKCDIFFGAAHFSVEHRVHDSHERFLSGLDAWMRDPEQKVRARRSLNAPNLFEADALAARAAREASRSPFYRWLEKQKGRNDPVGDLAGDILADRSFPVDVDSLGAAREHLSTKNAHPAAMDALKQAWKRFSASSARRARNALQA